MLKRNKGKLIASSIIILLPMLLGVFGDAFLPEHFAVHWGFGGKADGFGGTEVFFILPPILLAIHWLCMIVTAVIDKNVDQDQKLMNVMFWLIPVLSLATNAMIITGALGYTKSAFAIVCLLLSAMFIVIGNYMPKTRRSLTTGIKIRWAYSSDENWRATHRFAGKVYVAVGFACLLCMPLPMKALPFVFIGVILAAVLLPVIYSYRFYQKELAEGKVTEASLKNEYDKLVKNNKASIIVTVIMISVVAIVVPILMFTGNIEATAGESALTVEASFIKDLTLNYEDIDAIEYRENGIDGERVMGYGSARLLLGTFRNTELGTYTRYTYTGKKPCVVMKVGERYVVVGTGDAATTKELYDRISAAIAE